MIHAYREMYLPNAQAALGDAFDYAVNTCRIPGDDFVKCFVVSTVSKRMENGEPACIIGKSGIELAQQILTETTGRTTFPETNLKRIRTGCGYTQSELAKQAGVSLRSVQMYEQRRKNINKASAETLYRLSRVLGCSMEVLLEK